MPCSGFLPEAAALCAACDHASPWTPSVDARLVARLGVPSPPTGNDLFTLVREDWAFAAQPAKEEHDER